VSFHKTKSVKLSKRQRHLPFCQQVVAFLEIHVATDFAARLGPLESEEAFPGLATSIFRKVAIRMGGIRIGIIHTLPRGLSGLGTEKGRPNRL